MKKTTPILMILLLLAACSPIRFQTGRPLTIQQIDAVVKGETNRSEVKKLLGEPQSAGKDDDGFETWSYLYIEAEIPLRGTPSKEKFSRLTITFEEEKVKAKSYELSR